MLGERGGNADRLCAACAKADGSLGRDGMATFFDDLYGCNYSPPDTVAVASDSIVPHLFAWRLM